MSVFVWIVAGVLIMYGTMLLYLYAFQRGIIYRTDPVRPNPVEFTSHAADVVSIKTEDGIDLLGWWFAPKSAEKPVFLYLHGNAGHIGYRAAKIDAYVKQGYGVLLLAWRGYSGNDGRPTEAGLYEDGAAGLRWLKSRKISENRIVIYGESLGSGVAVELARTVKTRALVLETPFSSLAETAQSHYPFFPVNWLIEDRYDSIDKIDEVSAPVLIGHGMRDLIIPFRFAKKLFHAANEPKQFRSYENAGHNDLAEHGWPSDVIEFIEKN